MRERRRSATAVYDDVDLSFVAGDAFADAGGELAGFGDLAGKLVEVDSQVIEAVMDGVEKESVRRGEQQYR